jgi:hypothetical protein
MTLAISADLELPDQAVTRDLRHPGQRGMGKTNTAVVMAEEMVAGGHQIVAIDPTGQPPHGGAPGQQLMAP